MAVAVGVLVGGVVGVWVAVGVGVNVGVGVAVGGGATITYDESLDNRGVPWASIS